MSVFKNIDLSGYIKRYGLKYGFLRGLFMSLPLYIVKDSEMKKNLYYRRAEKYLKRKYADKFDNEPIGIEFGKCKMDNPIWILWDTGIDNAPKIVKACYNSVKKIYGDRVVLLDMSNIDNYIHLPDSIKKSMADKKISVAALSDIIRFSLLEHFGGTWIDATVLITDKLPEYMTESEFFMYIDSCGRIENAAMFESWLIHCKPHNEIIREIRNIMYTYFYKEKYPIEYLLCYIVAKIVIFRSSENYNMWRRSPYVLSEYAHRLFDIMDDEYCQSEFEYLCMMTSVHKLSYKIDLDKIKNDKSYYKYILSYINK